MTSLPRPFPSKTNQPATHQSTYPTPGKNICLIVGLTCLLGFLVDTLVLSTPPDPLGLEWRVNLLQQMGDRSIILLFAVALLMYAFWDQRSLKRPLGFICLVLGVAFMLSCVLVIRDSLILQKEALQNISNQEQQALSQIEEARGGNLNLPESVTPEQLQQASQQLSSQASALKENTRQGITKAGVGSMGNLIAVGLGLLGLGRLGIKRS
ncbi:HpsJ-like protein, cyanoexosortase C-associated [Leptothoe sp. PORK10 BA2]|uniref:HpsJ-like protein, cyanoexosortase C-associated n=1 Tax=Leptothoe sp. PORK10 BA2 TaxID=3110254 RepID=UPI002DD69D54|nr:HpsJ family protein [Leptothoe sp. PORK10 BA2]